MMKSVKSLGILLVATLLLAGCNTSVNSSIVIDDGESRVDVTPGSAAAN